MDDNQKKAGWSFPAWLVLMAGLGYFVYGGVSGAIAVMVLTIGTGMLALLGLIPLFGAPLYFLVTKFVVFKPFMSLAGLHPTILTSFLFWMNGIFAVLFWIVMTSVTLLAFGD